MNSNAMKHTVVIAALEFTSPRLKSSLLNDKEFEEQWGLPTIAGVTLGNDGPSFQRARLYGGIREAIRVPGKEVRIGDDNGATWRLTFRSMGEGTSFTLENGEKRFSIADHSGLAEDRSVREAWFLRIAREVNLDEADLREWVTRIASGPLTDEEFTELSSKFEVTPVANYRNLQSAMSRGSVNLATLVPSERRYYELLVGPLGSALDTVSYIEGGATPLIERLDEWNPTLGFLFSLLMCSKGLVSENIRTNKQGSEQLLRTYEWLANRGDPISQMGAVEVALRNIAKHRELEPFVKRMIEGFIADDPERDGGCFSLLSTMIMVVASELGRRHILEDVPPFYRKQAAIAQASLILRAMGEVKADPVPIVEWSRTRGIGHSFFLQGLVDLRAEPRWLPEFVSPFQLRAEFIGRVTNSVERCGGEIQSESLRDLVIGERSRLATSVAGPFRMFPGPLEGEVVPELPSIPEDVLKEVEIDLEAERLEPNSFAGLVNMALLFKMPASHAGLAAKALRRVKYSIENADDEHSVFALIGGLATVAAVTRGTDLSEELRVLIRVMRRRKRFNAAPDDEVRVAIMAAAAHEAVDDWARFFGEWMTELAFEVVEKDSAQSVLLKLRRLVQLEPALARQCAAADAALASVVQR